MPPPAEDSWQEKRIGDCEILCIRFIVCCYEDGTFCCNVLGKVSPLKSGKVKSKTEPLLFLTIHFRLLFALSFVAQIQHLFLQLQFTLGNFFPKPTYLKKEHFNVLVDNVACVVK